MWVLWDGCYFVLAVFKRMTLSALFELVAESPDESPDEQAFAIPCLHHSPRHAKGWTVWTFTDLDWLIMQGLPVKSYMRSYSCQELEEHQKLLAECSASSAE